MFRRLKNAADLLGKLFAAALLGVFRVGIYLRFKRGRVKGS